MHAPLHRLLATLISLLAAALTAEFFPAMKPLALVFLALSALLLLSGCTTSFASKLNKMPDGKFGKATLDETDKFTHTKIELTGVVKDNGELTAAKIHIEHTNPWVTNLSFDAEDYQAQLSAAAKKKPLPAPSLVPNP